jgi:soluble lytic murein transglycosylase
VALLGGAALVASAAVRATGEPAPTVEVWPGPGPALRHALAAAQAGDAERADRLLAQVSERAPVVADHADLLRLRLRVAAGRWADAVALRDTWSHPSSPLLADFLLLLGRAYAGSGDEVAARSAWITALARTDDAARLAELRLEIARSQLRSGHDREAAEAFLEIFMHHPATPADAEALAALAVLEARLGPLRSASAERRRGDAAFRERRNEEALAAYDAALAQAGVEPAAADAIRRQRAHTLFRLRRYPEAVRAFDGFPARTADRIERARAVARAGDVPAGIRELEAIAAHERGAGAAQAQLLAALLLDGEGEAARARVHYAELVKTAPRRAEGAAALWQLGWSEYRAGRWRDAMAHFAKLAPWEPDEVSRLRARYWHARAAEKAGDAEAAAATFRRIALEYPLSYYGWRASGRVPREGAGAAAPELAPVSLARGRAVLAPADLERARILLEAGLAPEANAELDRLFGRARGLDDRLALAGLYAEAGNYHQPQRLVVDAYAEPLARGPLPDSLDLWWHAWPAPYADEVREATAGRRHVDPALVYSIMREESGYRPEVLSVSGARGLLQLMPETAERVAQAEALAGFTADDLFVPRVNIALGSAYLEQLFGRFEGRPSAGIGSYNAGPHRVVAWLDGSRVEDDEWVEEIPYEQTRGYVKRVLRSLHVYRVLY